MKKRIATKIYNTDTADYICEKNGTILYQKRTRERGLFIVDGDEIKPVTKEQALEIFPDAEIFPRAAENLTYTIRVDKQTYKTILEEAEKRGSSMARLVAMFAEECKKQW